MASLPLCIPTLCNYDGVDRLLRSAVRGELQPLAYVVIDNGGGYSLERMWAALGDQRERACLINSGHNLGVAASWNLFLERYGDEPVVLCNDDIVLGESAFRVLVDNASHPIAGSGFELFVVSPECFERVGYFDENFWPAYHEDIDYRLRMARAGIEFRVLSLDIQHVGSETTAKLGDPAWLTEARQRNYSYLVAKWGANSDGETYEKPFGGRVPPGWGLRTRLPPPPLRWELVNELAELIGARRYLELGARDGSSISRVTVAERSGVHPVAPDIDGCSMHRMTPRVFFDRFPEERFDIIVLGHHHEQELVNSDIDAYLERLTPAGVLVIINASPHSEEMQLVPHNGCYAWTGDVWKSIVEIRQNRKHAVRVVDSDYGIAIVVPDAYARVERESATLTANVAELCYADLVAHRHALLGLVSPWEWREWVLRATGSASVVKPEPAAPPAPLRLNLGCSDAHLPGYVNVDRVPPADMVADLNERWPWRDSSVDEIQAVDCIEHLPDKIHTMNEAWRVLKPGGLLHIVVPTTDGRGAWQDPTHSSYWNRNSFWYYESGNAHRERFGKAYGVEARFRVEREQELHDTYGQIRHLDISLRADKPEAVAVAPKPSPPSITPEKDTLVVIFDKLLRSDTTGTHLLKAFEKLGMHVVHYEPCVLSSRGQPLSRGYADIDLSRARAILCIDDDIGWELPRTDVPMYYWCIDSYRLDDPLYIVGTRRERVRHFEKTFYVQRREARAADAPWLPLAVDPEVCTYSPRPKVYDWCFIGHIGSGREPFLNALEAALPNCFRGTAFGAEADTIYNQSTLALNLSRGPDINMRVFEGQATSALLISNRIDNGEDELFHHLPLFLSTEDCIAQMRMWLLQPELTSELASAQAADMASHTYEVRAREFLRAIEFPGY